MNYTNINYLQHSRPQLTIINNNNTQAGSVSSNETRIDNKIQTKSFVTLHYIIVQYID